MTNKKFNSLFNGVNSPEKRGAEYPPFEPSKVNTELFADELRPKFYSFDFKHGKKGEGDFLTIEWVSQGWDDNTDSLVNEIKRCMNHIGFVGTVKMNIRQRSYSTYSEFGKRRRFVLRRKDK